MTVSKPKRFTIEALNGIQNFNVHNESFPYLFSPYNEGEFGGGRFENSRGGLLMRCSDKKPSGAFVEAAKKAWENKNECRVVFRAETSNIKDVIEGLIAKGDAPEEMLVEPISLRVTAMQSFEYKDENMGIEQDALFLQIEMFSLALVSEWDEDEVESLL